MHEIIRLHIITCFVSLDKRQSIPRALNSWIPSVKSTCYLQTPTDRSNAIELDSSKNLWNTCTLALLEGRKQILWKDKERKTQHEKCVSCGHGRSGKLLPTLGFPRKSSRNILNQEFHERHTHALSLLKCHLLYFHLRKKANK